MNNKKVTAGFVVMALIGAAILWIVIHKKSVHPIIQAYEATAQERFENHRAHYRTLHTPEPIAEIAAYVDTREEEVAALKEAIASMPRAQSKLLREALQKKDDDTIAYLKKHKKLLKKYNHYAFAHRDTKLLHLVHVLQSCSFLFERYA